MQKTQKQNNNSADIGPGVFMITSLILLKPHSHWFSWLPHPVTTYVHLPMLNLLLTSWKVDAFG